jgi:hypothetical protein
VTRQISVTTRKELVEALRPRYRSAAFNVYVLRTDAAKHLRRRMEDAIADLLAVVADALDVLAVTEVQPDEMAKRMGVGLCQVLAILGLEQRRHVLFDLLLGDRHAVIIGNLQSPGEDVAQRSPSFRRRH